MPRTVGISPREGPGREPPPRRQKPYWPFPRLPRRIGGYRDESLGRVWPGCRPKTLFSTGIYPCTALLSPPPRAGAVQVISPGKACPGAGPRSRPSPVSSRAPDRGDIIMGEGSGREPPICANLSLLVYLTHVDVDIV